MVVLGRLLFGRLESSSWDVRVDLCDTPHGFCPSFSEDHTSIWPDVFWVLDETEATSGLIACSKVVSVHGDDGGSLSSAATVNYRTKNITGVKESKGVSTTQYAKKNYCFSHLYYC